MPFGHMKNTFNLLTIQPDSLVFSKQLFINLLHEYLLSIWISNLWKGEIIFSLWKHVRNGVLGTAVQHSQVDTSNSNHRADTQTCLDPSTLKMPYPKENVVIL